MKNTTFVGALLAVILISSAAIGVAWTIRNINFNLPGIFGWNKTIQTQTENQTQPDDYIMTSKPDGVSWSGGTETITAKPTAQELDQWLAFWNVLGVESPKVTRALNDQAEFSFDNNSDFITFLEDEK
jgi:Na+(H+)/acetate symporter ActP